LEESWASFPLTMERVPFRATVGSQTYGDLHLPVSILLHDVRSMYNVGAFFRTADGAGIDNLYLSGITARPPKGAITKTALGAENHVSWTSVDDPMYLNEQLRRQGVEVAAIETSIHALDLYAWQPRFPVCVMFGHEVEGLPQTLLGACDTHIRIPMLGKKHSLNVASAGAIVMYELLRKYQALQSSAPK
jgi:23S rRNA (guanosine2251-2'-O)-methyltransferase